MNEVIRLCMLICFLIIVSYFIDEVVAVNEFVRVSLVASTQEKFTSDPRNEMTHAEVVRNRSVSFRRRIEFSFDPIGNGREPSFVSPRLA